MKSEKFIDPKSDYAFKVIFGTTSNKDITIGFLNSLLDKDIRDLSFRNVEMQGMNSDSRRVVFDLFCEGSDGELFVVEIQKKRQMYFSDRVLYYASFAIQMQANIESERYRMATDEERKRWNYHISKVYVVCFLDYVMDPALPNKYRWDIVRMDRELKVPFSETLNEVYLELPKFRLELSECDTFYKKFLYAMNNIEIMEHLPKEMQNDALFKKLKSAIELQRMSAEERLAYELSISAERDLAACMATSYEDGKAEGLAEGVAKGVAEGVAKGLRQVAANLKRMGMDVTAIASSTGLDAGTIAKL